MPRVWRRGHPPPRLPSTDIASQAIPTTGEQVSAPTTDVEALRLLTFTHSGLTQTMQGLYQVYRSQGLDVLPAYVKTLEAWVKPAKGTTDREAR